jgi:tail protein P2 I
MASTFQEWVVKISAIPWMVAEWGGKWLYFFGVTSDAHADAARDAVRSRFIETSPVDALPYDGEDSNIERYSPDTDATYRERIRRRWDTWPTAGTWAGPSGFDGLKGQLAAFGLPNVQIYESFDWPFKPPYPYWSQFWLVVIDAPYTIQAGNLYDNSLDYDEGWVYDAGIDPDIADALRRLVKKWKPAHTVCREIIFQNGGNLYDGGPTYDGGYLYDDGTVVAISGIS